MLLENESFITAKITVKQEIIKIIRSLLDKVTIDDIMVKFYFNSQVDAGLKELDVGKDMPYEEVEKRMSRCS